MDTLDDLDEVELDRQSAFGQDCCAAWLNAYHRWMADNDGKDIWCEAVIKGVMWAAAYVVGEMMQAMVQQVGPISREQMVKHCMELLATGLDRYDVLREREREDDA
jgi:hypothetical protein